MKCFSSALALLILISAENTAVAATSPSSSSLRGLQYWTLATPCKFDTDCAPIQCFVAPCDENKCIDGLCELQKPTTTDEDDGDDEVPDRITSGGVVEIIDDSNTTITEYADLNFTDFATEINSTIYEYDDPADETTDCGPVSCAEGDVCCNYSCGYCTAPGGSCTKEFCKDAVPTDITDGIPAEEDEEEDPVETPTTTTTDDVKPKPPFWFFAEGDECNCKHCTICQKVFEVCIQINCDDDVDTTTSP